MKSEHTERKSLRELRSRFRRYDGPISHIMLMIISAAVSLIIHLIRLGFGRPLHSPIRDLLTFALFLFLIGELILRFSDPKFRRKLLLSLLRIRKKEPVTRQWIISKVLLALLALVGITFFSVHTTYSFDRTTERLSAQKSIDLLSGEVVEQEIIGFEDAPLAAVNIRFGSNDVPLRYAYDQPDTGTVHVGLYEDEDLIQAWDLPFSSFTYTTYRSLELDSLLQMQSDARYFLRIEEEYGDQAGEDAENREDNRDGEEGRRDSGSESDAEEEGEQPISLYIYTEGGEGYVRDGEPHVCCLCYTLTYRNPGLKADFLLRGILLGILAAVILLLDIDETAVMTVLLGVLMFVFMQICPPFMAPDEENHFKRAFEVAKVSNVSRHIGDLGVGGNELPSAIEDYVRLYVEKEEEESTDTAAEQLPVEEVEEEVVFISPASFPPEKELTVRGTAAGEESGTSAGETDGYTEDTAGHDNYEEDGTESGENGVETDTSDSSAEADTAVKKKPTILLDWDQTEEMMYGNTALYSPVSYLPMSAGIRIANVFSDNVNTLFYGGRWGNAIANFLLCILALRAAPFGKRILFLIMTFPMTLQEMVVMTPDGFTTAVCLFFLSWILRLSYRKATENESRIKKISPAEMAVLAVTAVVLSQLKIIYAILLLLIFMIPSGRFSSKRTGLLFKGITVAAALVLNLLWFRTSSGFLVEFRPGVDTPAQIDYVLSHIPAFYEVCARTLIDGFTRWISTMIGSSLGALTISTTPFVWLSAALLFVYETATCRENSTEVHRWNPLLLILSFLGGCALVMASLYVQWTPYRNPLILGIQGRYFTPLLPLLAFFVVFTLQNRRKQQGFVPETDSSHHRGSYCYLLILLYNGIAVLDMASYYIADLWK